MQRVRARAPGGKARAAVLPEGQADFGAAPGHPEPTRFDDSRQASRVSRPSPRLFRAVDLNLQTRGEPHQEIHLQMKNFHLSPACRMTNQKRVPRSDTVQRPGVEAN